MEEFNLGKVVGPPGPPGDKGDRGPDGPQGRRGPGILHITTAPTAYTTSTSGVLPSYRIALSTVKTQASTTDVYPGDTLEYSFYHYPVILVDASYVYTGPNVSIRGATGAQGSTGPQGAAGTTADIYSTAETKIGTWIDGKPLYRMCFVIGRFSHTSNPTFKTIYTFSYSITPVKIYGVYTEPNSGLWDSLILEKDWIRLYYDNRAVKIMTSGDVGQGYGFLEYTKDSDVATNSVLLESVDQSYETLETDLPKVKNAPASASSTTFDISINEQ